MWLSIFFGMEVYGASLGALEELKAKRISSWDQWVDAEEKASRCAQVHGLYLHLEDIPVGHYQYQIVGLHQIAKRPGKVYVLSFTNGLDEKRFAYVSIPPRQDPLPLIVWNHGRAQFNYERVGTLLSLVQEHSIVLAPFLGGEPVMGSKGEWLIEADPYVRPFRNVGDSSSILAAIDCLRQLDTGDRLVPELSDLRSLEPKGVMPNPVKDLLQKKEGHVTLHMQGYSQGALNSLKALSHASKLQEKNDTRFLVKTLTVIATPMSLVMDPFTPHIWEKAKWKKVEDSSFQLAKNLFYDRLVPFLDGPALTWEEILAEQKGGLALQSAVDELFFVDPLVSMQGISPALFDGPPNIQNIYSPFDLLTGTQAEDVSLVDQLWFEILTKKSVPFEYTSIQYAPVRLNPLMSSTMLTHLILFFKFRSYSPLAETIWEYVSQNGSKALFTHPHIPQFGQVMAIRNKGVLYETLAEGLEAETGLQFQEGKFEHLRTIPGLFFDSLVHRMQLPHEKPEGSWWGLLRMKVFSLLKDDIKVIKDFWQQILHSKAE